jgi:hypothetical protein
LQRHQSLSRQKIKEHVSNRTQIGTKDR